MLYPVQYLRAIAALFVFYYHYTATLVSRDIMTPVTIYEVGASGVDLFFVISGFIMAKIAFETKVSPADFMQRRLARIVPLYWAATILLFAIALFAPHLSGNVKPDWVHLAHSLLFLPYGSNGELTAPVLVVGWTLNYEMFFYILVALGAGLFGDRKLIGVSLLICALVAFGFIVQPTNGYAEVYVQPILLEFPMGIAVFHMWRKGWTISHPVVSKFLFATMLIVFWFVLAQFKADVWRPLYWGLPSAILLLLALDAVTFKSKFLRKLGDWSYSIYIIHLFVIMGFVKVVYPVTGADSFHHFVVFLILTGLLIIASWISFRALEKPMNDLLAPKRRPVSR